MMVIESHAVLPAVQLELLGQAWPAVSCDFLVAFCFYGHDVKNHVAC